MGEGSSRGAMDGYAVGRVDDNEKEGLRGLRLAAAVRNGELWPPAVRLNISPTKTALFSVVMSM